MPRATRYNLVVALILATGSFGYGFGFGAFVTSIGQPGFYRDMHLDRKTTPWTIQYRHTWTGLTVHTSHKQLYGLVSLQSSLSPCQSWHRWLMALFPPCSILGAVNALFAAGAAIGALAQGWLADWMGRKKTLYLAAVCSLIGAAWVAGSPYIAMFVTVRIVQGFGLGMTWCLVPLYMTEVSPPHCRGAMTGVTGVGSGLGYILYVREAASSKIVANESSEWPGYLSVRIMQRMRLCNGDFLLPCLA